MDSGQIVVHRCGNGSSYEFTAAMTLLDRIQWGSEAGGSDYAQDGDDHVFFHGLEETVAWCKARGYKLVMSDDEPPWSLVDMPSSQSQQPSQQPSQSQSQPRKANSKRKRRRVVDDDDDDDAGVAAVTDGSDDEDLDDTGSDLAEFLNDDDDGDSNDDDHGPRNMTTPDIPSLDDNDDDEELRPLEQWLADERKSVLMIGGAGTGKTEMIVRAVEMLKRRGLNPLILGSTGRAATNVQGRLQSQRHLTPSWPELPQVYTAHSADAFQLAEVVAASASGPDAVKQQARQTLQRSRTAPLENLRAADVIVIDEISMISAEDLALFCAVAKQAQAPREPVFLLVGDFFQLQPVSGEPCFDSPDMCRLTGNWRRVHILRHNRRQIEDPDFARILERVRVADFTPDVVQYLMSMTRSEPPEGAMCITPQNSMCDVLNDKASRRLEAAGKESREFTLQNGQHLTGIVSRQGNRTVLSKRPLPPKMMASLHTPLFKSLQAHVLTLHVGDMVMVKANIDTKGGIANGVRGEVLGFTADKRVKNKPGDVVLVKRQDDAQTIRIPHIAQTRDGWSDDGTRWRAAVNYMPLVRAWATTVHNAQGATIRSSIAIYLVDEQGNVLLFGDWCRLLYVAMSRATSSKQVYLVGFDKVDLRRLADSCREPNKRLADWMDRVQRVQEGSAEASQQSQPYDPSPLIHRPPFRKAQSLLRLAHCKS